MAAMWCQLGALLTVVLGGLLATFFVGGIIACLGWLVPLLIKNSFRGNAFVRSHANEAINFQLFWLIIEVPLIIVAAILTFVTFGIAGVLFGTVLVALGIFQLVVMIIATVKASSGQYYRFPLVGFRLVDN
jgi:uncharacterized Tic20 family protein